MKTSNRACNKRAITLDISILQNNKKFLELYPPIDLSLAKANKQGIDRWYNDLYIHEYVYIYQILHIIYDHTILDNFFQKFL